MSVTAINAEVVVTETSTGTVINSESNQGATILGGEPVFGLTRSSNSVPGQKGAGETPPVFSNAVPTMEELAKKHPGGDALRETNPNSRKLLPAMTKNTQSVHDAAMGILKSYDIVSVVESQRKDWFLVEKQMRAAKWLAQLRSFNYLTKQMEGDDVGFTSPNLVPFHIVAVVCLVKGRNPSYKRLDAVIETIEKTKLHALEVSNGYTEVANEVLEKVYTNHAKMAHTIYCTLVQVSDVDGLCKERASIIMDWVERLKQKVSTTYEILMKERMARNMQFALLLQIKKGNAILREETDATEEANPYDD